MRAGAVTLPATYTPANEQTWSWRSVVYQNGRAAYLVHYMAPGRQLTQHLELLCHKLHSLEAHAGSVAARPVKAGDETHCDRVAADSEDDRNGRGRGFGRER